MTVDTQGAGMHGWTGKILEVDLSAGKTRREELPRELHNLGANAQWMQER